MNPFKFVPKRFLPSIVRAAVKAAPNAANPSGLGFLVPAAQQRWLAAGISQYTPQRVEQVFRLALAGDLQSQWEMFDLMEATWPQLSKNLNELKDAACSMNYDVMAWAPKGMEPSDEAKRRAQIVEEVLCNMQPDPAADENDLEDTVRDLLDARGKGISVLEIDWQARSLSSGNGLAMAPRCTRWVHPSWYGYAQQQPNRLMLKTGGTSYTTATGSATFEEFPPNKFIIGVCKNKTGHPLGAAMLHTLGFWWSAINFTGEWFLNMAQVFGQPIRWANYDPNMDEADQAKLALMLENMGNAAWGMFPAGTTMELKEAAKSAGDNPQLALLKMADKLCDIVVLRQTLTSDVGDGGSGSRALGEVHERVLGGVKMACAKWAAKTLQQLVRAICILNFGDDRECPWLRPCIEDEDDLTELSEVLVNLKQAGLEPEDAAVEQISERMGFPLRRAVAPALPDPFGSPDSKVQARAAVVPHTMTHPSDLIAARKASALADAYRGSLAPVREIILRARSAEEAQHEMARFFADWSPERVNQITEEALQLCAAAGASAATTAKV